MNENETLEPPGSVAGWRVALKAFEDAGFKPGDLVSHDWLRDAFGIQAIGPDTDVATAEKRKLQYWSSFSQFSDALLEEDCIALESVPGEGYRVVPPAGQTAWANRVLIRQLKTVIGKASKRVINVDHSQLTADQLKENAEAQSHIAGLRALMIGRKRLTPESVKQIGDK